MKELNDIQLTKYFNLKEFQCPCCKCIILHPDLLKLLVKLRSVINTPLYINSGYRCEKENQNVGGTNNSYHRYGMAADVTVRDKKMSDLAKHARIVGFKGIGLYSNFLHLDIRPDVYLWEA